MTASGKGDAIDITDIVDRLETLVNTSKVMPMTGGLIVEKKKITELVDQLRLAIPQEVKAAEEVLARKDNIISSAMAEARRNKIKAEDEFRERLNQNELKKRGEEILREAEQRAARMVQQADADARSRRLEADVYALRSLQTLERQLGDLGGSVRKGIDMLAASASAGAAKETSLARTGNSAGPAKVTNVPGPAKIANGPGQAKVTNGVSNTRRPEPVAVR